MSHVQHLQPLPTHQQLDILVQQENAVVETIRHASLAVQREYTLAGWEDGDGIFDERCGSVGLMGYGRDGEVEGEEVDEVSDEAECRGGGVFVGAVGVIV
jgi:hypothetical protein